MQTELESKKIVNIDTSKDRRSNQIVLPSLMCSFQAANLSDMPLNETFAENLLVCESG